MRMMSPAAHRTADRFTARMFRGLWVPAMLSSLGWALSDMADAVVVGLPLLADGSDSLTTRQIRNFVRKLLHRLPCPVYLMEEFLSSEEAAWDLEEAGLRRSRRKAVLDQQAAVRILESYLHSPSSATLAEGDGYRAG